MLDDAAQDYDAPGQTGMGHGVYGDINHDGVVDVSDMVQVYREWGVNPGSPADLNHDGEVNAMDAFIVLVSWG